MNHSGAAAPKPGDGRSVNLYDISVIIPAWNASRTLERAVTSALSQPGVAVEVIVIDDCSTDDTLARSRGLADADGRVIVLSQPVNRGPAAARNLGLAKARGRYVTPLDSDDYMEPGRLAALLDLARCGWDFVADDLWQITDGIAVETAARRRLFSEVPLGVKHLSLDGFVRGNMRGAHDGRREIGFIKPLMCREFLQRHGLRYREDMRLGEDYDFYVTALLRGARFCLTDPAGYVAVMRPDSLSAHHDAASLKALVRADDRVLSDLALAAEDARIVRAHRIETIERWAWLELIESVRTRNVRRAAGAFAVPPRIALSLLGKLTEQFGIRGRNRIRSLLGRAPEGRHSG